MRRAGEQDPSPAHLARKKDARAAYLAKNLGYKKGAK
jgi:hypothetical protein